VNEPEVGNNTVQPANRSLKLWVTNKEYPFNNKHEALLMPSRLVASLERFVRKKADRAAAVPPGTISSKMKRTSGKRDLIIRIRPIDNKY
jgi:hypothetical protein